MSQKIKKSLKSHNIVIKQSGSLYYILGAFDAPIYGFNLNNLLKYLEIKGVI